MAGAAEESGDAVAADRRGKGEARAAELDRIDAKLERLSAQRRALRRAMRQFE
jgi:hypothetical protein